MKLELVFANRAEMSAKLAESREQGAMMLPLADPPELPQYARLSLDLRLGDARVTELEAELLQVMPGVGLVIAISNPAAAALLAADAAPAPAPSLVVHVRGDVAATRAEGDAADETAEGDDPAAAGVDDDDDDDGDDDDGDADDGGDSGKGAGAEGMQRQGVSVLSWPIERLQSEFHTLNAADKIRLAKYGKKPARMMIARLQDKMLQNFLLTNSKIGADEVAAIIGNPGCDPTLIKRVLNAPEWLRSSTVARALICNPKLTNAQVTKVMRKMSRDDLRRLARTGRVRANVKREIIRYLESR